MENIVRFDSRPVLKDPIFISALPGIGNVGKIAGDHFSEILKAEKFASIYSMNYPPQVIPDENNVVKMACNELWYARTPAGQDLIILRGDYQGSSAEGQFILAEDIMEILVSYGTKQIITLGGYGVGRIIKDRHVFGAVTRIELKEDLEKAGVTFNPGEPKNGIVGAAGLFLGLGQINGIDAFCLMGETSGFFADPGSAICILNVLGKLFGVEDLQLTALEEENSKIEDLTNKATEQQKSDDTHLGYIG